jgi:hypothetical protein
MTAGILLCLDGSQPFSQVARGVIVMTSSGKTVVVWPEGKGEVMALELRLY